MKAKLKRDGDEIKSITLVCNTIETLTLADALRQEARSAEREEDRKIAERMCRELLEGVRS